MQGADRREKSEASSPEIAALISKSAANSPVSVVVAGEEQHVRPVRQVREIDPDKIEDSATAARGLNVPPSIRWQD